jgi:DNA-binding XRE family transcriptional regulator
VLIKTEYIFLYKEDVKNIKDILKVLPEELWQLNTLRQDSFVHHKDTNSIIFCWSGSNIEDYMNPTIFNIENEELQKEIWSLAYKICKFYNKKTPSKIVRLMLARLPEKNEVPEHIDYGNLDKIHRCHIVIKTNNKCFFRIEDEILQFEEGDVVEINNQKKHEVKNQGDSERIHMICDIFPLK